MVTKIVDLIIKLFHCEHNFEKEIIDACYTSNLIGDVVVMTCCKCGKIKKKRI